MDTLHLVLLTDEAGVMQLDPLQAPGAVLHLLLQQRARGRLINSNCTLKGLWSSFRHGEVLGVRDAWPVLLGTPPTLGTCRYMCVSVRVGGWVWVWVCVPH